MGKKRKIFRAFSLSSDYNAAVETRSTPPSQRPRWKPFITGDADKLCKGQKTRAPLEVATTPYNLGWNEYSARDQELGIEHFWPLGPPTHCSRNISALVWLINQDPCPWKLM